jgi:raffinose/stachyose/melibiose transport system permease protein
MKRKNALLIVLFLFPGIFIYSMFYIFPMFVGFRVIFYESVHGFLDEFVGFKNFKLLFGHVTFREQLFNAIKNNFIFLIISLAGTNILGLIIAFVLSVNNLKFSEGFRNILFSPQVIPIITVGFLALIIFNPSLGTYVKVAKFLRLPQVFINLLGNPKTALYTIAGIEIVRLLGFPLTIYFVAINDISPDIIAASRIDGAGDFQILARVVVPLVLPTMIMANILMFIGSFIYFDLVYTMQGPVGGPAYATDVLGVFFFRITFGGHHGGGDPGIGAVVSIVMLGILAIATFIGLTIQNSIRKRIV